MRQCKYCNQGFYTMRGDFCTHLCNTKWKKSDNYGTKEKLERLLERIEKEKVHLYEQYQKENLWRFYDIEEFICREGRLGKLAKLYVRADKLARIIIRST